MLRRKLERMKRSLKRHSLNQLPFFTLAIAIILLLIVFLLFLLSEASYPLDEKEVAKIFNFGMKLFILFIAIMIIVGLVSGVVSHIIRNDVIRLKQLFESVQDRAEAFDDHPFFFQEFRRIALQAKRMGKTINEQHQELEAMNSQLEERIEAKTRSLEMAFVAQEKFVKNTIHEINTPLAVIQTQLDLLKMAQISSPQTQKIEAAVRMMGSLYADLSYFIRKDRYVAVKEMMNFSQFLTERVDYFRDLFAFNNLSLDVHIDPECFVSFDRVQLGRLCDNTLSNALKYAVSQSTITIILRYENEMIGFEVSNRCYKDFDPIRVFERYYRQDEAKGGFGIGLSLVAQICNENSLHYYATCQDRLTTFHYEFEDIRQTIMA